MPFSGASHHDVFLLVLRVGVLLLAARALGEICQRFGQPTVIGELLAGIILGPSVLGTASPMLERLFVPSARDPIQGPLLQVISLLGSMFLLLVTGLETDLLLIRQQARTAVGTAVGGLLVPFVSGFLLGQVLPETLLGYGHQRFVFSLFVATSLSISAISVIAKVLIDLNLMRRTVGQTIIAAGMIDDTAAWIMVGVIASLASGQAVSALTVLHSILVVLGFMVISFTFGRWLARKALEVVQDHVTSRDRTLTLVVVMMFLWGSITQAMRLEPMLGAFVMGVQFGQLRRLPSEVRHKLQSVAVGIFAPVFFATAGLKVNLTRLFEPRLILLALIVIGIASLGKVIGTYVGARLIGKLDHWTALSLGAGLNARGSMEIIVATAGLQLGVLSQDMYSIIVLMAMSTSLLAPVALRWTLKRVVPSAEELARLKVEELASEGLLADVSRVLVPLRACAPGTEALVEGIRAAEAAVLCRLGESQPLDVTLFSVVPQGERAACERYLEELAPMFAPHAVTRKVVESHRPDNAILEEAQRDYDLMVIGSSGSRAGGQVVINPLVDYLVRYAPCPALVIKGSPNHGGRAPERIVVRANGTDAARYAAETAFALADQQTDIILLHVVPPREGYALGTDDELARQLAVGHQIVDELQTLAGARGLATTADVRLGQPEETLLRVAAQRHADLIVLGTHVRPVSDRLFLGARVERILREAPCPVAVLNVV